MDPCREEQTRAADAFLAWSESRHWRHGRHFADGMPAMERLCVRGLAGPKF